MRLGTHHTEETRAKISGENHHMYGKHHSEETRAKLSSALSGENSPWYGKFGENSPMYVNKETRAKISAANRGKQHSEETLAKMSGENNHRWKGGISFEPYCPKFNDDLKRRIREFFGNQCVMCGEPNANGVALSCHHCSYDKDMCCNGKRVQFAALCKRHHAMTGCGDRQRWENMLHRVIDEIWDGKSYFTKEEYDHRKL